MTQEHDTNDDPIRCIECNQELPFAFEEQRGDIVCMTCVKEATE